MISTPIITLVFTFYTLLLISNGKSWCFTTFPNSLSFTLKSPGMTFDYSALVMEVKRSHVVVVGKQTNITIINFIISFVVNMWNIFALIAMQSSTDKSKNYAIYFYWHSGQNWWLKPMCVSLHHFSYQVQWLFLFVSSISQLG